MRELLALIAICGTIAAVDVPASAEEPLSVSNDVHQFITDTPLDAHKGRHGGHTVPQGVRGTFLAGLKRKGVEPGTAEVVAYAMGEDEIENLPPAMVSHLVAQLLHVETVYKKAQMALAQLDSTASFLVSNALVVEQAKVTAAVHTLLFPVGIMYGNDAIVKRIAQALNAYFQRQLADPYPWTYAIDLDSDQRLIPVLIPSISQMSEPTSYKHTLPLRNNLDYGVLTELSLTQLPSFEGLGWASLS